MPDNVGCQFCYYQNFMDVSSSVLIFDVHIDGAAAAAAAVDAFVVFNNLTRYIRDTKYV